MPLLYPVALLVAIPLPPPLFSSDKVEDAEDDP